MNANTSHKLTPRNEAARNLAYVWGLCLMGGGGVSSLCLDTLRPIGSQVLRVFMTLPARCFYSLLPFLLSAFAVIFSYHKILFLICGMKAACFGARCVLFGSHFGQGCWLAVPLLFFSEICSLPCLYYFWLKHISIDISLKISEIIVFILISALILGVDYQIITPFINRIMTL